jgi:hypothetical protein
MNRHEEAVELWASKRMEALDDALLDGEITKDEYDEAVRQMERTIGHGFEHDDDLEAALYELQYEYVKKEFGQEAADMANFGWGVSFDTDNRRWSIATKVYGKGVVQTEATCLEDVTHEFRPFEAGSYLAREGEPS